LASTNLSYEIKNNKLYLIERKTNEKVEKLNNPRKLQEKLLITKGSLSSVQRLLLKDPKKGL